MAVPGGLQPTTAAPESSSAPAAPDAIRKVDLASHTYRVGADERRIMFVDGKATDSLRRAYVLGKAPVYADLDADGFEDAAIEISIQDGNGREVFWYVLLWDDRSGSVRQIVDPLARSAQCGDAVTSVTARAGSLRVKERRTTGAEPNCASIPQYAVTRDVVVRSGWLKEQSAAGGYGGICPALGGPPDRGPAGVVLRIGRAQDAPRITGSPVLLAPLETPYGKNAHRVGWRLTGYYVGGAEPGKYPACAWEAVDSK